jgi:hypothetical protein
MYFSKLITFSLAAFIVSAGVIKRDEATFQTAFANVDAALTDFQDAINALQATDDIPTAIAGLTEQAQAFDNALLAGSAAINASSSLNIFEALGLVSLVNDLVDHADETIDNLIAKESIINGAGQDTLVVEELNTAKQASYSFIGAAVTHVPSATAGISNGLALQVIDIINRGIVAFGGTA